MQKIKMAFVVKAPIGDVFELFSDHSQFGSLFGSKSVRIKGGEGDADGVGSARRVGPWPISFEEQVLRFTRNRVIDYKVSKGGPFKNHLGQLRFREVKEGTAVDYFIRFESKIPLTSSILAFGFKSAWKKHSRCIFSRVENEWGAEI